MAHETTGHDRAETHSAPSSHGRQYLPAMGNPRLLPFYDALTWLTGARTIQWQLVAQAGIAPGRTVLEIGAGTGTVLLLAKRAVRSATVIGLDPDQQALRGARRRAARAGLELRLDEGYADRLPYADGSVDRVLSTFMLHHLPAGEQAAALREAHRVLAPGGSLHLADLTGEHSGVFARVRRWRHGRGEHASAHEPEFASEGELLRLMRESGFDEADAVGRRRAPIGEVVFYRAER